MLFRSLLTIRLSEVDVGDMGQITFEEGVRARPGVVDDLAGDREPGGPEFSGDPPNGRHRQQARDTGMLEGPQVRPVVDLVRRDRVTVAVAREKHHLTSEQHAVRE